MIKNKRILVATAVCGSLCGLYAQQTVAADASVEMVVGTKRVDGDLFVKGHPVEHVRFVARDLLRVAYDGTATNFLLGRAECGDFYGLKPALEAQKGDAFAVARGGVVYAHTFWSLDVFLETVANQRLNWEQTAIASYTRGPLQLTLEGVVTMDKKTPVFIATLPRVRYLFNERYSVGIGANTTHVKTGTGYTHTLNPGVTLRASF